MTERLTIVTWNMGCASMDSPLLRTHEDAWRYLLEQHQPDIALVQEAVVPGWLSDGGWKVFLGEPPTGSNGRAAIVARKGLSVTQRAIEDPLGGSIAPYVVLADLALDDGGTAIIGCVHARPYEVKETLPEHMKPWRRPSVARVWYSDVMFHLIDDQLAEGGNFIIGGDWNEARQWDVLHGEAGGGVEFFERAASRGWLDGMRKVYPEEQPTFLKGSRRYEVDHVFCSANLYPEMTLRIDEGEMVQRLSDHAILIATIQGVRVRNG